MQFFYIFSFFPNHDCKDIRNFNTKQLFESELPPTRFSMSPNHLINYFTSTYTSTLYSSSNLGKVLSVRLYTQNFAFYHQMQTPHLSIMPTLFTFYSFTFYLFMYSVGVIPSTLLNVLKKLDFLKPHFSLRAVKVYFLYSPSAISLLNSSRRYLLINS